MLIIIQSNHFRVNSAEFDFVKQSLLLSIYVISLYCNIKHLLKLENICINLDLRIDSQNFGTCDSHTDLKVKRSKVKVTGRGHIVAAT